MADQNAVAIASLKLYAPKMYTNLMVAVGKHRETLAAELEKAPAEEVAG